MPTDLIRYDLLVQDALKGVVRRVLANAIRDGIPGEHHFYLSFRTREKGVRISQALRDKYPDEMTIVLQHQFWDLSVNDHVIEVGLSFSNVPEKLVIPFDAVSGFFDPSVQFGLKFEQSKEGVQTGAAKALPSVPKDEARDQPKTPARAAAAEPKPARKNAEKVGKPSADLKPSESPAKAVEGKNSGGKGSDPKPFEGKLKIAAGPNEDRSKEEPKVISLDAFRKKP
jgi:hypothetical protein